MYCFANIMSTFPFLFPKKSLIMAHPLIKQLFGRQPCSPLNHQCPYNSFVFRNHSCPCLTLRVAKNSFEKKFCVREKQLLNNLYPLI